MRVVLDTNVVVSALLSPAGRPADVVMAAIQGHVIPLFDDRILAEYRDVLFRPKFRFDPEAVLAFLSDFETIGEAVVVGDPPPAASTPDPDDVPLIEVAIAGMADALVTGNRRHFPDGLGVRIFSPDEFVDELRRRGAGTSVSQLFILLGAEEEWVLWARMYGGDLRRAYDECPDGNFVLWLAERLGTDPRLVARARLHSVLAVAIEGIEESEAAKRAVDAVSRFEAGESREAELLAALQAASRKAHPDGIRLGVGDALWSLDATNGIVPLARSEEHARERVRRAAMTVRSIIPFTALEAPRRWSAPG